MWEYLEIAQYPILGGVLEENLAKEGLWNTVVVELPANTKYT